MILKKLKKLNCLSDSYGWTVLMSHFHKNTNHNKSPTTTNIEGFHWKKQFQQKFRFSAQPRNGCRVEEILYRFNGNFTEYFNGSVVPPSNAAMEAFFNSSVMGWPDHRGFKMVKWPNCNHIPKPRKKSTKWTSKIIILCLTNLVGKDDVSPCPLIASLTFRWRRRRRSWRSSCDTGGRLKQSKMFHSTITVQLKRQIRFSRVNKVHYYGLKKNHFFQAKRLKSPRVTHNNQT